jgi:hypothetical protein
MMRLNDNTTEHCIAEVWLDLTAAIVQQAVLLALQENKELISSVAAHHQSAKSTVCSNNAFYDAGCSALV